MVLLFLLNCKVIGLTLALLLVIKYMINLYYCIPVRNFNPAGGDVNSF